MRPRSEGGETSATYMGERMDAPPTASPPMKRANTKVLKLGAMPVAMEVAENSAATHNRMPRRPYRFVSRAALLRPQLRVPCAARGPAQEYECDRHEGVRPRWARRPAGGQPTMRTTIYLARSEEHTSE